MRISKIFTGLLAIMLVVSSMSITAYASTSYEYIPGYGMVEVEEVDPYPVQSVDNSGTFGLSVENFRFMCTDTGGEWDVVNGRHVCYCPSGEFNYPFGCPEVVVPNEPDYQETPDYEDDYHDGYNDSYEEEDYEYKGFWDTGGHPYEWYIKELAKQGIIKGYGDGSFRPDAPVTRAEMAKMVLMAANLQPLPCDKERNRFFADLDSWQAPWVNAGYRMDIIEGYGAQHSGIRLFKPNNYVNRVEGVKLVLASFGRRPTGYGHYSHRYTDVYDWMTLWIEDAYRIGLIESSPNDRFYPGDPMTRGMAAKVIVKMLQYSGDI